MLVSPPSVRCCYLKMMLMANLVSIGQKYGLLSTNRKTFFLLIEFIFVVVVHSRDLYVAHWAGVCPGFYGLKQTSDNRSLPLGPLEGLSQCTFHHNMSRENTQVSFTDKYIERITFCVQFLFNLCV